MLARKPSAHFLTVSASFVWKAFTELHIQSATHFSRGRKDRDSAFAFFKKIFFSSDSQPWLFVQWTEESVGRSFSDRSSFEPVRISDKVHKAGYWLVSVSFYFINCTFVSSGLNLGQRWFKPFRSNPSPGLGRTVCGPSSREAEVGRWRPSWVIWGPSSKTTEIMLI